MQLDRCWKPSNLHNILLGMFFQWIGWMMLNSGQWYNLTGDGQEKVSLSIKNCTVAPLASILTIFVLDKYQKNREMRLHFNKLKDGLIVGLVSISGASDQYSQLGAIIIGIVGALIYFFSQKLTSRYGIDDPVNASHIHGLCGVWGTISVSLLSPDHGIFYGATGSFKMLCVQFLGILFIIGWVGSISLTYFYISM